MRAVFQLPASMTSVVNAPSLCLHLQFLQNGHRRFPPNGFVSGPAARVAGESHSDATRDRGSGADRIVGAIRPGVCCGNASYAAMT